jgi:hypothetical protein
LIVRLQDADKIGHAGSITVFGHNRNLRIGCGLAAMPNPEQEVGDFFMVHSPQPTVAVDANYWAATRRSIKRKAGGRYAADLVPQLPARGAGSVALHSAFISSTAHLVDTIGRGYEATVLR